jgi:hypothetical protein
MNPVTWIIGVFAIASVVFAYVVTSSDGKMPKSR